MHNLEERKAHLLKQAQSLRNESLNTSFNKHRINDPRKTFLSTAYVQDFRKTGTRIGYSEYYDFVSAKLGVGADQFFEKIAEEWTSVDKQNPEGVQDRLVYLVKKFIINALDGLFLEQDVKTVFGAYRSIHVSGVSPEDDINKCVDMKLTSSETNTVLYIQVKPVSFFCSYKTTSSRSLEKISRASSHYKVANFLAGINRKTGDATIVVRNRGSQYGCRFIDSKTFCNLFYAKTPQESIFRLSQETFYRLLRGESVTPL